MAVDRIWLLRHAETTHPHVFNGAETDVGLSEYGVRQAAAVADWFRRQRPTAVVSSAMTRAIDTAAPIAAACGVPHLVEPELHERKIGPLAGTSFAAEGGGPWPDTVKAWTAGDTAFTTPGAESFDQIAERCLAAWERVVAAHPGGRVAVVAHGVVCKVLLLRLLREFAPTDWVRIGRAANTAVSELVPDGDGWIAERLLEVPEPVLSLTVALPASHEHLRLKSEG